MVCDDLEIIVNYYFNKESINNHFDVKVSRVNQLQTFFVSKQEHETERAVKTKRFLYSYKFRLFMYERFY